MDTYLLQDVCLVGSKANTYLHCSSLHKTLYLGVGDVMLFILVRMLVNLARRRRHIAWVVLRFDVRQCVKGDIPSH